jgi:hypothetical protein
MACNRLDQCQPGLTQLHLGLADFRGNGVSGGEACLGDGHPVLGDPHIFGAGLDDALPVQHAGKGALHLPADLQAPHLQCEPQSVSIERFDTAGEAQALAQRGGLADADEILRPLDDAPGHGNRLDPAHEFRVRE